MSAKKPCFLKYVKEGQKPICRSCSDTDGVIFTIQKASEQYNLLRKYGPTINNACYNNTVSANRLYINDNSLQLIVLKGNRKFYRYKKLSSMSSKPVTMSTIFY